MRILNETEYQQQAQPMFQRVFVENELYEKPFSASITKKVIVFPCEILPDPFLVHGLFAGAHALGDTGCYFTQLWRSQNEPNDCYIPLLELCEVCGGLPSTYPPPDTELDVDLSSLNMELFMNLVRENAFYSATGRWGLMMSHERFGVLGGSPEFMEEVRKIVKNLDSQVYKFLADYQLSKATGMNLTLKWLPRLLNHVYGKETAKKMLKEAGLP